MASFATSSQTFGYFYPERPAQSCFEDGFMGVAGAFAVKVIGFWRPVIGCRTITFVGNFPVADMYQITFPPDLIIFAVIFNQLVQIAIGMDGNILFELKPVKTGFPAVANYSFLRLTIEGFIHRFEQIGKPVPDKFLL
jgi:hypothetical protein